MILIFFSEKQLPDGLMDCGVASISFSKSQWRLFFKSILYIDMKMHNGICASYSIYNGAIDVIKFFIAV